MKITKEEERSKKKISTQIDFFLNDSSTRDFFQQQNLLPVVVEVIISTYRYNLKVCVLLLAHLQDTL